MRDINPLNVLNQRSVDYMPAHFTVIDYTVGMEHAYQAPGKMVATITDWIFNKLDGRFHVLNCGIVQNKGNPAEMHYLIKIGFEQAEESTFFSLAYSEPESSAQWA
ncbi:MAG: hypothetical protein ACKVJK_12140 [Methylophagaceae bacterium]|jgi:hypothetical protein